MATEPPISRQSSTRHLRSLWIVLVIALQSVQAVVASDPGDAESDENVPPTAQKRKAAVDGRLAIDIAIARSEFAAQIKCLDSELRQKIAIVTQVCGLTEAQKEKLELAGSGDNRRFLDRVEKIERQFELAKDDSEALILLRDEAKLLMRGFTTPGFSNDASLFVRSLEQLLTPEQAVKYAPLRVVFGAGGLLRLWQIGRPDEALEIRLAGTPINDNDVAFLTRLPSLKLLYLDKTNVTDAGLEHLKGAINLRELGLGDVPITDAGIEHLKGLKNLVKLSLKGTRVTATGAAEIQRAIPDLSIHR
jgi:hypothetical protein